MKKIKVKRDPNTFEIGMILGGVGIAGSVLVDFIESKVFKKHNRVMSVWTGYGAGVFVAQLVNGFEMEIYESALNVFHKFFEVVDNEEKDK